MSPQSTHIFLQAGMNPRVKPQPSARQKEQSVQRQMQYLKPTYSQQSPHHLHLSTQTSVLLLLQPAHTVHNTSSTAPTSTTWPDSESLNTATTSPGGASAGSVYKEVQSVNKFGGEEGSGHRSSSPLDPLLAGLLSVFIVTTAIVFVVLFLKFRQRTNHPEFHRLQDLPMDDLMEDTPLSRYTY